MPMVIMMTMMRMMTLLMMLINDFADGGDRQGDGDDDARDEPEVETKQHWFEDKQP